MSSPAPRKVSRQFLTYWLCHPSPTKTPRGTVHLWTDPRILDKKFYAEESAKGRPTSWTAVDNCGGEFFTEEFESEADAIAWLNDPEQRTGDDWKRDKGK